MIPKKRTKHRPNTAKKESFRTLHHQVFAGHVIEIFTRNLKVAITHLACLSNGLEVS